MANRRFIDFPIASTSGDTDIILIWQDGANKQTTKATFLSGLPENLDELNDVAISGLTNGQILRYDSVTGKWENTDQGNLDLNDLNDVSIVSPSNGQVLVYNSSTSKWENSSGGYVPYVGAVTTVDLGAQGLRAGYVRFDTSVVSVPDEQGLMYWDGSKSTVALIMNGTLQHIGQDTFFYCKNSTGSSIPKGTAVRFDGTDGASGHLKIAPFLANGTYPSTYFMGVTAEEIGNGEFGQVMHFGELEGIDTTDFDAGDLLYASTTDAGGFQITAPVAPNNIVLIAAAVNSKNNGAIIVRPTYGSNINNDEGVKITSPTTGDLLQLQAGGLWENKTLAQVLGGTSSQFVKGDGSLDSTSYQPLLTNPVTGTGASGQVSFWNGTTSQTGDNGLFWDNTNKRLGIGTAMPSAPITIQGSSSDGVAVFRDTTTLNTGTGGSIRFEGQTTTGGGFTTGLGIILGSKENATSGNFASYLAFQTRINGGSLTERWRITSTGILQSNGAQTIQTSTGNLTLTSADNTGIVDIRRNNQRNGAELRITNSFVGNDWLAGDIVGTLNFVSADGSTTQPIRSQIQSISTGGLNYPSQTNLTFSTTNGNTFSEGFRLTHLGNLHIGTFTSDNGARLQVSGTLTASTTTLTASANTYAGGSLKLTSFTGGTNIFLTSVGGLFALSNGGGADHLLISSTGAATFSSSVTANGMTLLNSGGTYLNYYVSTYLIGRIGNVDTNDMYYDSTFGGNHYFRTGTGGTTSPSTKLTITSSGNVGIGTIAPAKKLDVYEASTATVAQYIRNTTVNGLLLIDGTSNFQVGTETNHPLLLLTNNTERIRITSGGDVYLNNGAALFYGPTSVTYVVGSSTNMSFAVNTGVRMTIGSSGVVTIANLGTGTVTATAGVLSTVSDSSYKIEDGFIDSAIEKILSLKPRYFYWNEKSGLPTNIRQLGFYAQEVNQALGEEAANTPQNENTPWGISDRSIIAMLTKAIQELKQEIDTLKN